MQESRPGSRDADLVLEMQDLKINVVESKGSRGLRLKNFYAKEILASRSFRIKKF